LETTGFEYARGDRIIEIGAVEIVDGKITGRTFHEYINPQGKIIPPSAYAVHKISNDFLNDKPIFQEVAPRFLDFVGEDAMIVAHNGSGFDFPFINYELARIGLPQIPFNRMLDTIILAKNKVFGPKNYTLDSLAKWFGVSLTARADAHGALIDTEILAKVYLEIEQSEAKETIAETIRRERDELAAVPKTGGAFPKREFKISDEELDRFNAFLASEIKNPLWRAEDAPAE
jgi:DNA polymerase-3 subunit epsilon